jgi:PadR family transcriptional regulator, regulatory protein PadR
MSMDDERQLFRGTVRLLLLERLARGESYGYAIVVELRALGLLQAAESTVYPALARLEKDGLVATRLEASGRGAARKYYRLTDAGRHTRDRARAAWDVVVHAVSQVAIDEGDSHATA